MYASLKKKRERLCIMKDEGRANQKLKNFQQKVMFPFFRTNENNVKLGAKNLFGGENPTFLLSIIVFSQQCMDILFFKIIFVFIAKFG
jgi:hypothetical protein